MTKLLKKLKNNKGFTLIELVIIIAILGTLTAIALPRFSDIQYDSEYKADIVTATSIGKAAELYFVKTRTKPSGIAVLTDYLSDVNAEPQYTGFTGLAEGATVTFQLEMGDGTGLATVYYKESGSDKKIKLYPNPSKTRPSTF